MRTKINMNAMSDGSITLSKLEGNVVNSIAGIEDKQDILESGINIKTINGESVLGSGDINLNSYITTTSISSIPTDYKLVKCTIANNGSFTVDNTSISAGKEIQIVIYNSSSTDITISIPTSSPYVNLSEDVLTVVANGYAEINIISDGTNLYIRHMN